MMLNMSRRLTPTVFILALIAIAMGVSPLSEAYGTPSSLLHPMPQHAMNSAATDVQHEMNGMTDCEIHCVDMTSEGIDMASEASCAACCIQMCASLSAVLGENPRYMTVSLPDYAPVKTTAHLARFTSFDPPPPRL